MRKALSVFLLLFSVCLSSIGQVSVTDESGMIYDPFGGAANIENELVLYRDIYGQYPNDKKALLNFIKNKERYNSADSLLYLDQISFRNKSLSKLVKKRRNRYVVSEDTCSFYIAKTRTTIQCIGGVEELQKSDSYMFRLWTFSRFFDKNGNSLLSLSSESPFIPRDIIRRFNRIVTTDARSFNQQDTLVQKRVTTPVLIPITMTRNGVLNLDVSCLDGLQLYYQDFGKPFNQDNTIGSVSIETAIDSDYLDAMMAYLNDFMDKHEEVGSMRLWELVLFNDNP